MVMDSLNYYVVLFFCIFYTLIASLAWFSIKKFDLSNFHITTRNNDTFIDDYFFELKFIFSYLWPFTILFICGMKLGQKIYEDFIFTGDEEDRITSWVL